MGKWFRTRFREAREQIGLSHNDLGEKFGVTRTTVWNWENGVSNHAMSSTPSSSAGSKCGGPVRSTG